MIPVIVIFAPTACGKTALVRNLFGKGSLSVFKDKAEIISADSQAVYRKLNIGTAKPDEEECHEIPYHLINLVEPEEQFGMGEWVPLCDKACSEIWAKGKIPVVTGGTGFYIRNFILGMSGAPVSVPEIRDNLKKRIKSEGNEALFAELTNIDPVYAAKINVNDAVRICRALEVYYSTGKTLSSYTMNAQPRKDFDFCTIILDRPRDELYQRIDERVEQMFAKGLEAEVKSLISSGYNSETAAMKAIGYREFFQDYADVQELKYNIKNNSHHYAKKQYTYMKGIPGAETFYAEDTASITAKITEFMQKYAELMHA